MPQHVPQPMMVNSERWVLVVDRNVGRLFRWRYEPQRQRCQLSETARFDNPLLPHDRGGRPPTAGPRGVDFTRAEHDRAVMRDQYASECVKWLQPIIREQRIDRMHLFAGAEMIGAVRRARGRKFPAEVIEHEADIAHLKRTDLEKHPRIQSLRGP